MECQTHLRVVLKLQGIHTKRWDVCLSHFIIHLTIAHAEFQDTVRLIMICKHSVYLSLGSIRTCEEKSAHAHCSDALQSSFVVIIVESYYKSDITCLVIVSVISAGGERPRDTKGLPG